MTTIAESGSGLGAAATPYNFASMTNAQVYNAAHQLGSEGKISPSTEGMLQAMAAGGGTISIPIDPALRGQLPDGAH
jgi:hypothetical protein